MVDDLSRAVTSAPGCARLWVVNKPALLKAMVDGGVEQQVRANGSRNLSDDGFVRRKSTIDPLVTCFCPRRRCRYPLFVAQAEKHGGVPGFVLRAAQRFLACGDLSRGFVLVKCDSCDLEMKVAFSCKERSVCPSCSARRAALGAAHLVDYVLPRIAWRQWTLAIPRTLRVALPKDEKLLSKVLGAFIRTVFAFQRLRAQQLGFVRPLPGAIAFIQNFTDELLVHPHFHVLFPDGVFEGKDVAFAPLPPPNPGTGADVVPFSRASASTRTLTCMNTTDKHSNVWPGTEPRCS